MARVPDVEIEQLKEQVSLVSLAEAAGVELRKTGADLTGCCPFHEDSTPSLVISPAKNLWQRRPGRLRRHAERSALEHAGAVWQSALPAGKAP